MTRFFSCILCFLLLLSPVAARASLNGDVQLWLALRDGKRTHDFQTYARFLNTHKDWPETTAITLYAEQALLKTASTQALLQWFRAHKPVTDSARARYIMALNDSGDRLTATQFLRETWRAGYYDERLQGILLSRFGGQLQGEDHEKRADTLLWQIKLDRAERAITYIPDPTTRETASVRLQILRASAAAVAKASRLSATQRQDNGLLVALARYHRNRNEDALAAQHLAARRNPIGDYDAQWWRERNILTRRALERGNYQQAYNLVRAHGHDGGVELAEAEFLAGWLAVTRLKQPSQAFKHFERMYRNVKTPISVARAAYWAGIAADQMKDNQLASQWYRMSAVHMNTFYGQLAAYALGNPKESFRAFFAKSKPASSFPTSSLRQDLIGAATILHGMNKERERDAFLRAALRAANENGRPEALIQVAQRLDSQPMALIAAKAAYERGVLVQEGLFPRIKVPPSRHVEPALTLGIIRQESQFDRFARSSADARGLMQLLPSTARQTARQNGIAHNSDTQLFQGIHNMTLGQAFLGRMLGRYDNFVPLAAAAYNAGPGNVDKWLREMGDPRKDPYSWVDWVERIPFYETRNYVQRVWEAYTAYQYLLGK